MKIGLYFGSFNPIHTGHLIIANHILNETGIEKVWLVVSPQNPFKTENSLLNEYHRLHLAKLAIGDDNRIKAAACVMPLSSSGVLNATVERSMGLRHRAALGISEVSDAIAVVVSEETGNVSYASGGELHTAVTPSDLREQLHKIQKLAKKPEEKTGWHIRGMRQKVEGEKK